MGIYLNPGNGGFERIVSGKYIDKTGLIAQRGGGETESVGRLLTASDA